MSPRSVFAELKRRNVYKVAVAYAVVAWLLIQAASILFPTFEAPPWVMKVFVAAILSGFPIALILAWAFELTPEGIVPTEEVPPAKSIARKTGRKLVVVTVIVGLIAAGLMAFQFLARKDSGKANKARPSDASQPAAPVPADKSIAVLPFENLSDDKANAFFASGIQDEILTSLAKISGLKVISRTSTARFGTSPENLPAIAKQLGVAHILEGSVQKAADKVHINVQLIRAASDEHVWAQSYDRSLADIFAVEAEVARSVAEELRAALSPQEKARVSTKPTQNADAYVLYLRANEYSERPSDLLEDEQSAAELYTKAIALDPTFAVAHARLASVLAHINLDYLPTAEVAARARAEAEESLRLQPDLADGHHARAMCLYWIDKDYDGALHELEIAGRLTPNSADIGADIAYIRRRQGQWNEARRGLEGALILDPGNAAIAHEYLRTLCSLRDWSAAAPAAARAVALAGDSSVIRLQAMYVEFWSKGDLKPLFSVLAAIPSNVDSAGEITLARWDAALLHRDFDSAAAAVAACRTEKVVGLFGSPLPKPYLLGAIALARGGASDAQRFFEEARPALEAEVGSLPLEPFRHAQLALLYVYMGRNEDAVREARRAVELRPESRDHVDGALFSAVLALVYARAGEADLAIPMIERLLTVPLSDFNEANISLEDLRHRWQWDPVRNDPRFQKILAAPEPKTVSE